MNIALFMYAVHSRGTRKFRVSASRGGRVFASTGYAASIEESIASLFATTGLHAYQVTELHSSGGYQLDRGNDLIIETLLRNYASDYDTEIEAFTDIIRALRVLGHDTPELAVIEKSLRVSVSP